MSGCRPGEDGREKRRAGRRVERKGKGREDEPVNNVSPFRTTLAFLAF